MISYDELANDPAQPAMNALPSPGLRTRPGRSWPALVVVTLGAALLGGCAQRDPPETTISWLAPQTRAAKSADCAMPVLAQLPNADYQEIAIVEVADDYNADDQEVAGLARRKACETGADALVILENKRQKLGDLPTAAEGGAKAHANDHTPEVGEVGHKGRILNAVAIIYKTESAK
jgi:hypothetical protein